MERYLELSIPIHSSLERTSPSPIRSVLPIRKQPNLPLKLLGLVIRSHSLNSQRQCGINYAHISS